MLFGGGPRDGCVAWRTACGGRFGVAVWGEGREGVRGREACERVEHHGGPEPTEGRHGAAAEGVPFTLAILLFSGEGCAGREARGQGTSRGCARGGAGRGRGRGLARAGG